ncbi:MAG: tetratricopeptide repeat protein, partial [Saprospiraceae bacterium]
ANLAKQYANEIKILSCQPNEYSIEGEQWGGGRGAFSYNFINGLYGLADFNKDGSVSVFEIGRYLEDHVPAEVAPVSQLPMILGDKSAMLSQVDDQLLAEVTSGKSNQIVTLSPIESKGIEEQILMTLDSSTRILYQSFYTSLREKVFLQPSTKCADYYYNQLIAKKELNKLYSSMRRNFAAALQDDAQQVMNQFISGDREIFLHTKDGWRYKFKRYPSYLARAAELLGEDHIMYSTLQARRCFFEGFLIALENENPNQEAGNLALQKFNEALRWQKDLPQVYWQISKLYGYTLIQADSMEYYALKAMDLQPGWVIPYELLAGSYLWPFSMPEKAKYYLEKAATIDSSSSDIKNIWGMYYSYISDLDNAEYYYKKAIQLDSLMGGPYINLGILYVQKAQYDKAIPLFSFLIKKYPSHEWAYRNLGTVYFIQGRYSESEKLIRKSLELDSNFMETHIRLADLLFQTGRIKEAGKHYIKATQLNAFEPYTWYHLMLYYLYTGQTTLAEKTINHAINLDSTKAIHWVAAAHFNLQIGNILTADIQLEKAFSLDSMLAELYSEIAYLRIKQAHFEDAIVQSKKSLKTYPGNYMAMIYLAIATTKLNREQEGINWLEKSIQNGAMYPILMALLELESLRKLKEWNLLINKYFSGKVKD